MLAVMASSRHSGAVSAATGVPATTFHPVSGERVNEVFSATPSRETVVSSFPSSCVSSTESNAGDPGLPMVCSGLGTRAMLTPLRSKIDIVQSSRGRCCWMMCWNISSGGLKLSS